MDDGKLVVLGVVQEQHAERARLYKQWRDLQWPIVQDAFNLLQIKAVPLAVAIDEHGIVRSHRANPKFVEQWIQQPSEGESGKQPPAPPALSPAVPQALQWASKPGGYAAEIDQRLLDPSNPLAARAHFELGVLYRMRFDSHAHPADFQASIDHWSKTLELDPNQYIYRRRIQQYGARLGKPYPFYDWVAQARLDIENVGGTPLPLKVALSGAEIAQPQRRFETSTTSQTHPDPQAKIQRDAENLIQASVVVVPRTAKPGKAVRVHVLLQPADAAKWNNESEPTQFWVDNPEAGQVSQNLHLADLPSVAESTEIRRFEFEVQIPELYEAKLTIPSFALMNVCHRETGVCIYLRKDVLIELEIDQ